MRLTTIAAVAVTVAAGAALAQTTGVQPGMWESTSTVDSIDMASAPPQVVAAMKGHATTVKHCMTPEEAAGGPQAAMRANKSCTFPRYTVGGGRFESEMVCRQGAVTSTATGSGTYTPTTYAAKNRIVSTGPMPMTMILSVVGRRIGDCR